MFSCVAIKPNANEMYMYITQMILPIFYMHYKSNWGTFSVLFYDYANGFLKIDIFICEKIFEMYPTQIVLRYLPQRKQKSRNIGLTVLVHVSIIFIRFAILIMCWPSAHNIFVGICIHKWMICDCISHFQLNCSLNISFFSSTGTYPFCWFLSEIYSAVVM